MTQIFRVELEGVDITDHTDGATISKTVNRFYNVGTVNIHNETIISTILGSEIVIYFGDNSFSGFAYSTEKISKESYRVMIRTEGAKLSEPFSSYETTVDDASTATELCLLYGTDIGYPISYTSEELTFGGSYERNGTYLTALSTLARTVGAEYYDNGSGIIIEPSKTIQDDYDHELGTDEYFNFVVESFSLYNGGVGTVKTSTGWITGIDIVEDNKINMEVFEDGTAHVYCIPKGTIESAHGISIEDTLKTKAIYGSATLINEIVVKLKASIQSVESVTLNGVPITNYNFTADHGVIFFNVPQTGFIEINYVGYYQIGIPEYTLTPNGNLGVVDMYYLNQRLNHYWYIGSLLNTGGYVRTFTDPDPFILQGFNVYMLDAGVPKIRLYANGVLFATYDNFTSGDHISKSFITLSPIEATTDYEYRISKDATVELITSFGNEITASLITVDGEEKVLTFDKYYPKVELTISEVASIVAIDPTTIEGEILLTAEDINTGLVSEFDIGNVDANDISTIPCILDQFVPLDVATLTRSSLTQVAGAVLKLTTPEDVDPVDITVGADGIAKIWVDRNGTYQLWTAPITNRTDSFIELIASV